MKKARSRDWYTTQEDMFSSVQEHPLEHRIRQLEEELEEYRSVFRTGSIRARLPFCAVEVFENCKDWGLTTVGTKKSDPQLLNKNLRRIPDLEEEDLNILGRWITHTNPYGWMITSPPSFSFLARQIHNEIPKAREWWKSENPEEEMEYW